MSPIEKVYVVVSPDGPQAVFEDKLQAHNWAEYKYGSRADGICLEGVYVTSCVLKRAYETPGK